MKYLITIFIFLGLLSSCSKSPACWGDDKNKGIINNSIIINCSPTIYKENYVITSDSIYQQIFLDTTNGQTICQLPNIDFSKETLLGIVATGQCNTKVIREVISLDNEKKYHYKVKIRSCGQCKKEMFTYNWVTVPKLPSDWTVSFEVAE